MKHIAVTKWLTVCIVIVLMTSCSKDVALPTIVLDEEKMTTKTPAVENTRINAFAGIFGKDSVISPKTVSDMVELKRFGKGLIKNFYFTHDSKQLAVNTINGVFVYSIPDLQESRFINSGCSSEGEIERIYNSPDGQLFALVGPRYLCIWDIANEKEIWASSRPVSSSDLFEFSPDSQLIALENGDGKVQLFGARTGKHLGSPIVYTDLLNSYSKSLSFSPDGSTLLVGFEGEIRQFNVRTGEELAPLELDHYFGGADVFAFSPDGLYITLGKWGEFELSMWNAKTGKQLWVKTEDDLREFYDKEKQEWVKVQGAPLGVRYNRIFSPDGQILATTGEGSVIRLWDARTGEELQTFVGIETPWNIVFSPDSQLLAAVNELDFLRLWDVKTGEQLGVLTNHSIAKNSAAISPDGQRLAVGSVGGVVQLYETQSEKLLWESEPVISGSKLYQTYHEVKNINFSVDGQLLAVQRSGLLSIYDTTTGEELNTIKAWVLPNMSDDLRTYITESGVYDSLSSNELFSREKLYSQEFFQYTRAETQWVLSPDGQQVAIFTSGYKDSDGSIDYENESNWDKSLTIRDLRTGEVKQEVNEDIFLNTNFISMKFTPDSQKLAILIFSKNDKTNNVYLLDLDSLEKVKIHRTMSEVNLKLLTFSPDGRFVALAKQKEIINWWESKSGKHLCLILVNHYSYPSYSFSPDGNLLGVTTEEYSKNNEGLWDTQSCDLVYDFKENVDSITFSADGRLVAIVHEGLLSLFGMP